MPWGFEIVLFISHDFENYLFCGNATCTRSMMFAMSLCALMQGVPKSPALETSLLLLNVVYIKKGNIHDYCLLKISHILGLIGLGLSVKSS